MILRSMKCAPVSRANSSAAATRRRPSPVFWREEVDGQQAEIGAFPVAFDVDAAGDLPLVFGHEKGSAPKVRGKVSGGQAVLVFEEALDLKSSVDEVQDRIEVGLCSSSNLHKEAMTRPAYCVAGAALLAVVCFSALAFSAVCSREVACGIKARACAIIGSQLARMRRPSCSPN